MTGIFFLVGGIAQLFWIRHMVKKWGNDLVLYRNCLHISIKYNVFYHKSDNTGYSMQSPKFNHK